jgi:hypothetical protein
MNIFARLRNLLRRFARRVLEKHAEQLYEGPEPPIAQIKVRASAYTLANPEPNRDQWIAFATKLAANCYREGFQRGFEWRAKGWPATGGESPEHHWPSKKTRRWPTCYSVGSMCTTPWLACRTRSVALSCA